jgi:hypothetical protein
MTLSSLQAQAPLIQRLSDSNANGKGGTLPERGSTGWADIANAR